MIKVDFMQQKCILAHKLIYVIITVLDFNIKNFQKPQHRKQKLLNSRLAL